MNRLQTGRKLLRLLFSAAFLLLVLAGCGSTKYEAVDLTGTESTPAASAESGAGQTDSGSTEEESSFSEGETETDGSGETMAALIIGEDGTITVDRSRTVQSEEETAEAGNDAGQETAPPYEDVDDTVEVLADVLNVRAEDNQNARIYVQLKTGDRLHRTGIGEEWSRVIYDGKTAYVANDMIAAVPEESEALAEEAAAQAQSAQEGETEPEVPFNGHIVAIDAGRQAKANLEKEPIGPGSETMKAKMPEGAVGVDSGVKEYELTLTVAQKLEAELLKRGYQVVMIRNSHDVNLSNAERSAIANESGADILIRLYANSMDNSGIYGALTSCMTAQNPYNAELHDKSYSLCKKIVDQICAQTGTKNRGVQEVDNNGAINWSEIPVSVVEMGFLSNPDEDRWLQDDSYQNKLAAGIVSAIDSYFAEGN